MNLAASKWDERFVSFRSPTKCPALGIPLRNVSESAFWAKHLSEQLAMLCWGAVIVGLIFWFISLIVALQATNIHTTQVAVARSVTAFLVLFFSLGLIKLAMGYRSLSKNSTSVSG